MNWSYLNGMLSPTYNYAEKKDSKHAHALLKAQVSGK
jgi:hypothetical protein